VALYRIVKPGHPKLMPIRQKRPYQIILAGEMPIERYFGDTGLGNHFVNTGSANPIAIKQIVSSQQDTLAWRFIGYWRIDGRHIDDFSADYRQIIIGTQTKGCFRKALAVSASMRLRQSVAPSIVDRHIPLLRLKSAD
jgi:hypothetical protein